MRLRVMALMAMAMALTALPSQAQWKWKDSRGQVHVSDLPPPREVPDKDVLQRPDTTARRAAPPAPAASSAAASASAAEPRPLVDPELEARRSRAEQEQRAKSKADEDKLAAQRKENCKLARAQLAGLDSGVRIARINANGEREILDDQGRAAETQRARTAIAADCK